jgi:hypothetical protein
MEKLSKRYKKISDGVYQENEAGFVRGVEWTDEYGTRTRVLFCFCVINPETETLFAEIRHESYIPKADKWVLLQVIQARATMNSYVNMAGELQSDPFQEDGVSLKSGIIPEYTFWDNILHGIFTGTMDSILARRLGV